MIKDKLKSRSVRVTLVVVLVAVLAGTAYLMWPSRRGNQVVAYFSTAVGLYPGDDVRIVGVPVGTVDKIEPQAAAVKVTMTLKNGVKVPADARALIISPNLVSSRFVQFTPAYSGGAQLAAGGEIPLNRTGVPVEWDDVKKQLTSLSAQLGPQADDVKGPLATFVNQAADTLDGNGDSFRSALRELSQTAGRLGDSRGDLFGTIKNLQILVNALSGSNEQIVQFTDHVASVSQVLAESSAGLDQTLGALNQALGDVKGLLKDNNAALIDHYACGATLFGKRVPLDFAVNLERREAGDWLILGLQLGTSIRVIGQDPRDARRGYGLSRPGGAIARRVAQLVSAGQLPADPRYLIPPRGPLSNWYGARTSTGVRLLFLNDLNQLGVKLDTQL